MTGSQLLDLDRYLARRGFRPHSSQSAWHDRDTGHGIIRVVRAPDEQTQIGSPGAWAESVGWRLLGCSLEHARMAAEHPNGPEIWNALLTEFAAELQKIR